MELQHRRIQHAHDQMQRGQVLGAIETLAELLGEDPENADAHAMLALALVKRKRLHAARLESSRALELDPDHFFSHVVAGTVASADRRFADAENHLKAAQSLSPENDYVEAELARLYLFWGRVTDAARHGQRALELDPDDADHITLVGEIHLARGQVDLAFQLAQQALEQDPEHVDALVLIGRCELASGRVAPAKEHAVWALQLDPEDPGALALLCAIKARTSLLLGLWWRFQAFVTSGGSTRGVLLLVGMYLVYRTGAILLEARGQAELAAPLSYVWLAFCVYTWVAPTLFAKSLAKEMEQVKLRDDF